MADSSPDAWGVLADDIRRARDHAFDPASGCRCASCLERRGYAEQAETWQARATQAEARVAELEAAITNALQCLRHDFPHAAAARLREAGAPDHA